MTRTGNHVTRRALHGNGNGNNGKKPHFVRGPSPTSRFWPRLLDQTYDHLRDGHADPPAVRDAMDHIILALRDHKLSADRHQWEECVERCRSHPLKDLLHEDPFTHRAFSKPRGYAGDAVLLDYIYGREDDWPRPGMSPLGERIFEYTTLAPAPEGVRARRGFMADLLDRLAVERGRPHALSIAAGHLREAELSAAVRRRKYGRLVALDSDPKSLEEVRRCYGRFGVETVTARISRLLTGRVDLGRFDLVYSTGLFDYLGETTAQRLVSVMFGMIRPGGRVVVANFLPGVRDVGYMEVFMDWNLVYRTRREMMDVTMEIPQEEIGDISVFTEENHNIIFLEMSKN